MNRLRPDDADARFIRRVLIVLAIVAVAVALYRAGDLLILAFGSSLGAIAIHALAEGYERRLHLPEKAALAAGMTTAIGIVGFLVWLFGIQFAPQVNAFVTALPQLLGSLAGWLSQSPVGAKLVDANSRVLFAVTFLDVEARIVVHLVVARRIAARQRFARFQLDAGTLQIVIIVHVDPGLNLALEIPSIDVLELRAHDFFGRNE